MIRAFFDYWSELNKSGTKMRYELEKTWELPKRLVTWANRERMPLKPEAGIVLKDNSPENTLKAGNMEHINFQQTIDRLKDTGFSPVPNTVNIHIPEAKRILWSGIKYFTQDKGQWLPEYNEVVNWLTGNNGRGLLCFGNCGRGKTLICGKIIPLLLNHYCRKVVSCYDAQQMNANLDEVKRSISSMLMISEQKI